MTGRQITSKGQITLPKVVREALALRPGDRIRFVIQGDGTVTVEAELVHLATLRGTIKPAGRRVTIEQMNVAVRVGATSDKGKL